jgi:Tfp pilus assembly protein PilF
MSRIAASFAVGLAAWLVAPSASAAAPPPDSIPWTRYQSRNFDVFSSAPPRRTEDSIVRLERFRDVLDTVFPGLDVASNVDTTVFVFKDEATMAPFLPRYAGKAVAIDGEFVWRRDANYVIVNGSATGDPMPAVYHEYMHYFTMRNLPRLPAWFEEGIAECYETFRTDGKTAELGRAKPDHILFLRQAPFMPLDQLFAVRHDSPDYNEGDRRSVFYAESWALVHYLLWDTRQHRQQVVQFLERLGSGQPPGEAFAGAFGIAPAALEAELRRNLERGTYLKTVVTLKGPPIEASIRRSPVSRAEIQARFGDFLVHTEPDRPDQAEGFLRAALATEPGHAVALRALALLRKDQGKADEAKTLLEQRLAADPRDAMAAWSLGEILMEEDGAMPRARSLLKTAAGDRPEIPEIAVAYGRSLLAGSPEPSAAELEHAITLLNTAREKLRYRADVLATQAVLFALNGNLPAAESLVTRALSVLGDPEALAWARGALDRIRGSRQARQDDARPQAAEAGESGGDGTTDYNRDVDTFNRGIELANQRNYSGALALLEPLYATTTSSDIKDRLGPLLADLRQRAGRK